MSRRWFEGNALSYFGKFYTTIYNYTFGFIHFKKTYTSWTTMPLQFINSSEVVSNKSIKDLKGNKTNGKELIVRGAR